MKKQIIAATTLALLSTGAFASKARMAALGQSTNGSFYMQDDSRYIFSNPAGLNEMTNYVTVETGTARNGGAAPTSNATPSAEGGFFRQVGSFSYGVYLGGDRDNNNSLRNNTAATNADTVAYALLSNQSTFATGITRAAATGFLNTGNSADVFIGGDAGLQWGARVNISTDKYDVGSAGLKQNALGVSFGVIMGSLDAYVNADLSDKSEGALTTGKTSKWEADLGLRIGANYKIMGMNVFGEYDKSGFKYTNTGVLTTTGKSTVITVGAAKVWDMGEKGRWFTDIKVRSTSVSLDNATTKAELGALSVPLTAGFEADAASWLTLRGSVSSSVFGDGEYKGMAAAKNGKFKNGQTTGIGAGATLKFGQVVIDGSLQGVGTGTLTTSILLGDVSLTYNF